MQTIDDVLARLHLLPAIPTVVQELLASFESPDVDIDVLADKISHDQALTTKVLRVANSSFYGFPRQIASIHDAVVVMGLAGVRSLVLSAGFVKAFGKDQGKALDRAEYWERSFRVASYAKSIARSIKQAPEVAFIAGMLHDVGQLVLDTCLPQEYAEVVAKAQADGSNLIIAEEAILGFHHGILGAEVARRWNFPSVIEQAIRDCHSDIRDFISPISAVVCMAVRLDRGESPEAVLDAVSPEMRDKLGLDAEALVAALPDPEQLGAAVAELLG